MINKEIAILGAGPAGLAAAFELSKAKKSSILIEKNKEVGGLGRTFTFGNFKTDLGPHRFFSQNKYLYDLIADLLGKHWIKVDRLTRFYINGKFFLYPIEFKNALFNVGPYKAFRILFDYIIEKISGKFVKKDLTNFENYIVSNFGRTLAELNMLNYTEKIWGLPCSKISADWSAQRIKGLSLTAVIKKLLIKSKQGPKTLVDQFYYPDEGTALIYDKLAERVKGAMGTIKLNSHPLKIIHKGDKITELLVNADGDRQIVDSEYVISSIPITELINLFEPKPPVEVLEAAKKLKFRSHVSLFVTLDKPSVFPDQWLYFPDAEIPFGRIMEPKNFSKKLSPPDKTSLLIEFFCWKDDKIWNADKRELLGLALKWLEKHNFVKKEEILESYVHKEVYAYPVYDLDYKKYLDKVKEYLNQFKNLQLIGRAGSFRYNNQDHALEMGILAARTIIEGKQYDIDQVGAGKDYFERGYIQ
jgi:protoporphyrinogen oxidase